MILRIERPKQRSTVKIVREKLSGQEIGNKVKWRDEFESYDDPGKKDSLNMKIKNH